jgi:hypothetical protein
MNFKKYEGLFENILTAETPVAPYDQADYIQYVELNHKRQDRWIKKGDILPETQAIIGAISTPQKWVLITEPWCGDAAHLSPFIAKMAELNPNIELTVQLRDSDSEIDQYLTDGGKSIPKLIVRNENNEDLFVWGPRPAAAQKIHLENLTSDKTMEEKKVELQKWYNKDKGASMQAEIASLLKK